MNKQEQVAKMTDIMAKFVDYSGKHLPDDVEAKLKELAAKETVPLPRFCMKLTPATRSWRRN